MKICLVSQEYPPETGGGGIGTQTYLKAHGLSARGHDIHVVSASWDREDREYKDGDATIHRIAEPRLPVPGYEESSNWLAYSHAVAGKLTALTRDIDFDVIQFPEYAGEGLIFQTDTFEHRRSRYVVQLHGPLAMFAEHMGWPERWSTLYQVGAFMERTVMHHADLVLASSYNTGRFCAEQYGYPVEQIQVIHSGVNTELFSPGPAPDDARTPRILFIGNFAGNKGFNRLIDAVIGLKGQYPRIAMRMIGKGDEEHIREANERIRKADAMSNIELLGYVPHDELPGHFAWCDLFAGPSTYEPGPGNVYLEAMACARPVVACDSGGTPEVVTDGETGLLIKPDDTVALADAIARLASDPELRSRLGRNGRKAVESEFSTSRYIDKVEGLYEALCARVRLNDWKGDESGQ